MQKLLFSAVLALGLFTSAIAQQFPYQFSYSTQPYAPLTNATVIDPVEVWDTGATVPFGFNFQFAGSSQSSMLLDGYSGALFGLDSGLSGDTIDAIFGYAVNPGLIAKNTTIVRHITEGTAPNRIAKVEFFKAGFDFVAGEVSFQIWLYETTNAIQIRLGQQTIPNPEETFFNQVSPLIGYMVDYYYSSDFVSIFPQAQFVVGTPAVPQDSVIVNGILNDNASDGPLYGMTGLPLANSVFTYTPGVVSTQQPVLSALRVSPNPAQDVVRLEGVETTKAAQVQLMDQQGRVVSMLEMAAGDNTLQLPSDLAPGLYTLRYNSGTQMAVSKLMKM